MHVQCVFHLSVRIILSLFKFIYLFILIHSDFVWDENDDWVGFVTEY